MFFKIYNNLIEINPNLLKVEDKHFIIEEVHGQVLNIFGEDELNRQAHISGLALE